MCPGTHLRRGKLIASGNYLSLQEWLGWRMCDLWLGKCLRGGEEDCQAEETTSYYGGRQSRQEIMSSKKAMT